MITVRTLKQRIRAREATIGSWVCLGDSAIVEIMADAGFDWLVIDLEHSAISIREAAEMIRVADLKGVPPLVRLSGHDWDQAKRVLDAGAHGIIVPMVKSAEQAQAAVGALRYPPSGQRGVGLGRAQGYGPGFEAYALRLESETIIIAQIEHAAGIDALEDILAVDALDATIIGPYDLSGSIGKPGQFADQGVAALLDRYAEVSQRCGRAMGFHVVAPDHKLACEKLAAGYTLIALGVDFLFLGELCRREVAAARHQMANLKR